MKTGKFLFSILNIPAEKRINMQLDLTIMRNEIFMFVIVRLFMNWILELKGEVISMIRCM